MAKARIGDRARASRHRDVIRKAASKLVDTVEAPSKVANRKIRCWTMKRSSAVARLDKKDNAVVRAVDRAAVARIFN